MRIGQRQFAQPLAGNSVAQLNLLSRRDRQNVNRGMHGDGEVLNVGLSYLPTFAAVMKLPRTDHGSQRSNSATLTIATERRAVAVGANYLTGAFHVPNCCPAVPPRAREDIVVRMKGYMDHMEMLTFKRTV